jgi:DNA polymerase III delta prime subunit
MKRSSIINFPPLFRGIFLSIFFFSWNTSAAELALISPCSHFPVEHSPSILPVPSSKRIKFIKPLKESPSLFCRERMILQKEKIEISLGGKKEIFYQKEGSARKEIAEILWELLAEEGSAGVEEEEMVANTLVRLKEETVATILVEVSEKSRIQTNKKLIRFYYEKLIKCLTIMIENPSLQKSLKVEKIENLNLIELQEELSSLTFAEFKKLNISANFIKRLSLKIDSLLEP